MLRMLPFAFFTNADCYIVAGHLGTNFLLAYALQECKRVLPLATLLKSTGDCVVDARVGKYYLLAHGLQQSQSILPLLAFLTSADCCTVTDGVWHRPSLALFQEL